MSIEALVAIKACLEQENARPGAIGDTLWMSPHETLFDFIDGAIEAERETAQLLKSDADKLLSAIASAAQQTGIYNGETALTGPHALMLLQDLVVAATQGLHVKTAPTPRQARIGRVSIKDGRASTFAFERTDMANGDYSLYTSPEQGAVAKQGAPGDFVGAFDAAVEQELPRVSHLAYDSQEICKHFASKLRAALTPQSVTPAPVGEPDGYVVWAGLDRMQPLGQVFKNKSTAEAVAAQVKSKAEIHPLRYPRQSAACPPQHKAEPNASQNASQSLAGSTSGATGLDVTLEGVSASLLHQMLAPAIDGDTEPSPVRLLVGAGHSGYGLYAAQAERQDEGAVLLAALPAPPGLPLGEQDFALLDQAHEMLLEHAEGQLSKGNDSAAMGATCSADAVLKLGAQAARQRHPSPTVDSCIASIRATGPLPPKP